MWQYLGWLGVVGLCGKLVQLNRGGNQEEQPAADPESR